VSRTDCSRDSEVAFPFHNIIKLLGISRLLLRVLQIYPTRASCRTFSRRQLWQSIPPNGRVGLLPDLEIPRELLAGTPPNWMPHDEHLPELSARLE